MYWQRRVRKKKVFNIVITHHVSVDLCTLCQGQKVAGRRNSQGAHLHTKRRVRAFRESAYTILGMLAKQRRSIKKRVFYVVITYGGVLTYTIFMPMSRQVVARSRSSSRAHMFLLFRLMMK